MKELENKLINNPDGAVSDVSSRTSYYWVFEEAAIHVRKERNEHSASESASLVNGQYDILRCLNPETERVIRRAEKDRI